MNKSERLLTHLRAMKAAVDAPAEPAPITTDEVSTALESEFATLDTSDTALPALQAAMTVMGGSVTAGRAYAAPDGFQWQADRNAHPHHAFGHALGAVLAHVAILGGKGLGRIIPHHARRVVAHALHGAAHAMHPHEEGGS